jgi:hypothetical protein
MVGCLLGCTMPCSSTTMFADEEGHSYGLALQVPEVLLQMHKPWLLYVCGFRMS